jgi:hypothetical protein
MIPFLLTRTMQRVKLQVMTRMKPSDTSMTCDHRPGPTFLQKVADFFLLYLVGCLLGVYAVWIMK